MSGDLLPVFDLHSDLLTYLLMKENRTPFDAHSRASINQMQDGKVKLQTLAIFTYSSIGSIAAGQKQIEQLFHLLDKFSKDIQLLDSSSLQSTSLSNQTIYILPAFENACGFSEEHEDISLSLKRLANFKNQLKNILYISMTWNGENRFGGGNGSNTGLKEDGKRLLEWMHEQKIAIDLSHTSDFLAADIINFIDKYTLNVPIIASHSNFRTITHQLRNLPDEIAKEIINRKGLIGLNLFAPFIGIDDHKKILKHIEYGLTLGGNLALCFGSDFFCDQDFPSLKEKYNTKVAFFSELSDASKYPYIFNLIKEHLGLSEETCNKIFYQNAKDFIFRSIF